MQDGMGQEAMAASGPTEVWGYRGNKDHSAAGKGWPLGDPS